MQLRGGRARSGPEFFGMWLYDKETEVGRDVLFFWGQSIQSSLTAQDQEAYRDGVPDAGKPTRTALQRFFWS